MDEQEAERSDVSGVSDCTDIVSLTHIQGDTRSVPTHTACILNILIFQTVQRPNKDPREFLMQCKLS